ncbi:MAG: hypothetical protein DRZ90_15550 [Spirochaetes bacterium]|nr:MAG: hypothetical protein DRZ90_15550 [Spirochaetota bacterium]
MGFPHSAIDSTWIMPSLSYAFSYTLSGGTRIDITSSGYTLTVRDSQGETDPFSITYPWN